MSAEQVREPRLLTLALSVLGCLLMVGAVVAGIGALAAFGHFWWAFAAIAVGLACLILAPRFMRRAETSSPTARQRVFRRILIVTRMLLCILLACWLGLILWAELCPGGLAPAPKTDPNLIRVLTWNVHCGQEDGSLWQRFDWAARKQPMQMALEQANPDILCVQEALPGQVEFLEQALPSHRRVGVGRNDGQAEGEHCAIWFRRDRFEEIGGGTFWLEEPIDEPRFVSVFDFKRICTWVRLRDRTSGRSFRLYNTHNYLTEEPRLRAARLILAQIAAGDPVEPVLLTADFNASPGTASRQLFLDSGLANSAVLAGKPAGEMTFQLYGVPVWSLDAILVSPQWRVRNHGILDVKPDNIFPSDHFGVLADLSLPE